MGPNASRLSVDPRPVLPPRPADYDGRPEILLVSLGGMINRDISYNNLVHTLVSRGARVFLATNHERCLRFIETGVVPKAIIVADEFIQRPEHINLLGHVQHFVSTGGSLVLCLDFARHMDRAMFQVFMTQVFGVRWRFHAVTGEGEYIKYNHGAVPPGNIDVLHGLPMMYSQCVASINNVQPDDQLYVVKSDMDELPQQQLDSPPAPNPAEHSLAAPGDGGLLFQINEAVRKALVLAASLFRTEDTNDLLIAKATNRFAPRVDIARTKRRAPSFKLIVIKEGEDSASCAEKAQANGDANGGVLDMETAHAVAERDQHLEFGDDDYGGAAAVAAARMQMNGFVLHEDGWVIYCGNLPDEEPWFYHWDQRDTTSEIIATLCGLDVPVIGRPDEAE